MYLEKKVVEFFLLEETGKAGEILQRNPSSSSQMKEAVEVIMKGEALINASAGQNGDGGKVVLWSDINNIDSITSVSGNIYSHGGTEGGNGGMVETSGRKLEINDAFVSTLADKGRDGTVVT